MIHPQPTHSFIPMHLTCTSTCTGTLHISTHMSTHITTKSTICVSASFPRRYAACTMNLRKNGRERRVRKSDELCMRIPYGTSGVYPTGVGILTGFVTGLHTMRRFALLLPLLLITAVRGEEPTKVATVEGVTEYRLANGARVLLYPEPSRPTITVNIC